MTPDRMRTMAHVLTALADADVEVDAMYEDEIHIFAFTADQLRDKTRVVKAIAGTVEKRQGPGGLVLAGDADGCEIIVQAIGGVCERVQVGTRTVTKPDPAAPLVDVEVPVYETRCPESVLAEVAA